MYLKPRLAGVVGMVAGLAMAGTGGWLIAHPPLSLLGVVVLVAASILCAVAATWTVRRSWSATDWPDLTVSEEKALRRARRVLVMQCVLAPLMIGGSVWIISTRSPRSTTRTSVHFLVLLMGRG